MCGIEVTLLKPVTRDDYAHLDHIIPLSKGGPHLLSNVQTLCRKCNLEKSDMMPDEINKTGAPKIATTNHQDTVCETTRFFTRITKQGGSSDIDYG